MSDVYKLKILEVPLSFKRVSSHADALILSALAGLIMVIINIARRFGTHFQVLKTGVLNSSAGSLFCFRPSFFNTFTCHL